jgi:hypothetical protein
MPPTHQSLSPVRREGGKPLLYVSDGPSPCGAWTRLQRAAEGPGADTLFDSTPAFVFPVRWQGAVELQVYCGDRWNLKGPAGVANASYAWLPMAPAAGGAPGFSIKWLDSWRLGDFKPVAPS